MNKVCAVSLQYLVAAVFLLTGNVLALNATDTIQAESFSGQSGGIISIACREGGQNISGITNGSYIYFNNVNFGTSGVQSFECRMASDCPTSWPGNFIEIHLDSPTGTLIGKCEVLPPTGGWQTWNSKACSVTGATGTHAVYLVFIGSDPGKLFNLNWVKFHGTPDYTAIGWRYSTNTARGKWGGTIALTADATPATFTIIPDSQYQRIDGWGGAFSDNGAHCIDTLNRLHPGMGSAIMENLFGTTGARLNVGRVPIGMNDFTVTKNYSLDEIPAGTGDSTDFNLKYFTLAHDSIFNIPYVKSAMKRNPNIMIYGCPWTPPTWMKSNKGWQGSAQFNQTAPYLTTYAAYFRKFVQGWKNCGIAVNIVYPQNEPEWNVGGQPACGWTGTQMKDFLKNYVAPDFKANNIPTQLWLGNFMSSSAYATDCAPALHDSVAARVIRGAGIHRNTEKMMKQAMDTANLFGLYWHGMQDETMCWSGANSWTDAESTYKYIDTYAVCGCHNYNMWNMVLDSNGNYISWMSRNQNSPVVVGPKWNPPTVKYTGEYYCLRGFSQYVAPGAVRVKVDGGNTNAMICAFKNPDGSIICEVWNKSGSTQSPVIQLGDNKFTPTLAAHSFNTFIIGGDMNQSDWVLPTTVTDLPIDTNFSGVRATPRQTIAAITGPIGVYDIRGRLIKMLNNRPGQALKAGSMVWDRKDASGRRAAPGLYIIMSRSGKDIEIQKVMVNK